MKAIHRTNQSLLPTFDNLWKDFFSDDSLVANRQRHVNTVPAVNVREEDSQYLIEVAAPGMRREDFQVEVVRDLLTISSKATQAEERQTEAGTYTRREFRYHQFSRSFAMPDAVEHDQISAKYENGVLFVALPKQVDAQTKATRTIDIG
jgi:HSP20 family protein